MERASALQAMAEDKTVLLHCFVDCFCCFMLLLRPLRCLCMLTCILGADALRPFAFEGIRPHLQAYAVVGWWLDNLLKGGKLNRHTYLTLAAQVTVGFPEDVRGLQGGRKVLARRVGAGGGPCSRTSPRTNKAANESFPRSGGRGQFVSVKFWDPPCLKVLLSSQGLDGKDVTVLPNIWQMKFRYIIYKLT